LRLGHAGDKPPSLIGHVSNDDDHGSADVQRPRPSVDVPAANGP
jgi:hypothetical protein